MTETQPRTVSVCFLPAELNPEDLPGTTAVIVDILRASTTITTALSNGAAAVKPCLSKDEARAFRTESGDCLLGGERGGLRIDGFDLSNSPADYAPDVVGGRTIGFTTTNGTRALLQSQQANVVLIGAFVNLIAVAERVEAETGDVAIVCAGTNDAVTGEDVLFAGALARKLESAGMHLTDSALIAATHWSSTICETPDLFEALCQTQGGRNLVGLGFDSDISLCADVDSLNVVPQLAPDGLIRQT